MCVFTGYLTLKITTYTHMWQSQVENVYCTIFNWINSITSYTTIYALELEAKSKLAYC